MRAPAGTNQPSDAFCLGLTGLPSAGTTTIARELARRLEARGRRVERMDGDEVQFAVRRTVLFDPNGIRHRLAADGETEAVPAAPG